MCLLGSFKEAQKSLRSIEDAHRMQTFCLIHSWIAHEKTDSELELAEYSTEIERLLREMRWTRISSSLVKVLQQSGDQIITFLTQDLRVEE